MTKVTHKGWFLFAPVYLDMTDPECPGMWARWGRMEFLVTAAHECQAAAIAVLSALVPDYEPAFAIWITGEVSR